MDHLAAPFQEMWRQGEVPQGFKGATIAHLYKRKGNRQVCDNHRGISLPNIAGKIFARILLNRLNNHLEQGLLPEIQCGFRCHRGTTDMIFAARQLQEKCQEMRTHLYSIIVDLAKSFDTVNREGPRKIMQKFGCPERFIQMVRQLHDGMMARVTDNGAVSEAFAVTNGVKHGCVLAPTLFSLMFSAMLFDAYRNERLPIRIAYRTDGHLLNRRRMHFQSRVSTTTVHELLFADDCALNTSSVEEMQRSMDLFPAACENFGLVINTQKTVVMHQPPPNSATPHNAPPQISVKGTQLQVVENFPYLGSTLSRNTKIDDEVANRISKASQAFGRLQSTVWSRSRSLTEHEAEDYSTPPHNSFQSVLDVNGHSGLESDLLDIFGSTAHLGLHQLPASSSSSPPPTNSDNSSETPLPSSSSPSSSSSSTNSFSSSTTPPATAAQTAVSHITNPDTTTDNIPTSSDSSDEDQDYTGPHCDRTFTSRIGLVGHLRIHRTETGEPVPGVPTYTHCPRCSRAFTHRMGLFGHMRIQDDLR
nr:unnamed protein product [Spirometra erinaceieuropaei]